MSSQENLFTLLFHAHSPEPGLGSSAVFLQIDFRFNIRGF